MINPLIEIFVTYYKTNSLVQAELWSVPPSQKGRKLIEFIKVEAQALRPDHSKLGPLLIQLVNCLSHHDLEELSKRLT